MIVFKTGDVIKAADINANFDKSNIKVGTVMIFVQREAPTYWVKQNIINDAAIRVVSDLTGGNISGSISFSTLFSSSFDLSMSGNVGATTLTIDQMPSHSHSLVHRRFNGGESANISALSNFASHIKNANTGLTGGSKSHTHSLSGSMLVNLAVKYINVIACKKN